MGAQGAVCGHSMGLGCSPCGCASCCADGRGGLADKGCGKVQCWALCSSCCCFGQ